MTRNLMNLIYLRSQKWANQNLKGKDLFKANQAWRLSSKNSANFWMPMMLIYVWYVLLCHTKLTHLPSPKTLVSNTFHTPLDKVTSFISKQDTNMRDSIPAKARLEATLIFLSTGCRYTSLQYTTRISKQSLSDIIPETCQAIYQVLHGEYLQVRQTL